MPDSISTFRKTFDRKIEGQPSEDSEGPTPNEGESKEGADSGPTPESQTATASEEQASASGQPERSEGPESDVLPQGTRRSQADEQESEEEEVESAETDQPEGEDDDWFLVTPESKYRTEEDAATAVGEKDELILDQRDTIENLRHRVDSLEAKVEHYEDTLDEEEKQEVKVRELMIEELPEDSREEILQMSQEELEDNPEAKEALRKARIRAEYRYEQQKSEKEKQAEKLAEERQRKMKKAKEWAEDNITADFFDVHSIEGEDKLGKFLAQEVPTATGNTVNRAELAVLLRRDLGENVAQTYIQGLRDEFRGESTKRKKQIASRSKASPEPDPKEESGVSDQPPQTRNSLETLTRSIEQKGT